VNHSSNRLLYLYAKRQNGGKLRTKTWFGTSGGTSRKVTCQLCKRVISTYAGKYRQPKRSIAEIESHRDEHLRDRGLDLTPAQIEVLMQWLEAPGTADMDMGEMIQALRHPPEASDAMLG
jgi:hypothetical protein